MIRYFRLLLLYLRVSIQHDAAYRFDFAVRVLVSLAHLAAELMAVWIIFSNTDSLNGWGVYHTLALLGVYRVMIGTITLVVAPNMRQTMEEIRHGTFDFVLLRPASSQFLASFRKIVLWQLTDILLGMSLAGYATVRLLGTMPPERVGLFLLMVSAAAAIVYSIWLIVATSSFWFTRIANIEMVFWNVFEVGRYPVAVYPPWLRWMLTFVLPMAFVTTFPAQTLVGRLPGAMVWTALVLAPAMVAAASWFWRFGIRRYSGASA